MKKVLKIALLSVLGLVVVAGVLVWMEFGPLIKGANSCVKLDDGLYYMEYRGDDGFDGLMAKGGFEKADDMVGFIIEFLSKGHYKPEVNTSKDPYGCSALTVSTPGGVMMGRNFDFPSAIAVIMHCIPDKGYETITTFNAEFYGFGKDYKPEGFKNQYMALTGLFVALDGINEKGLAIADLMAGDTIQTNQRTSKPDLTTTAAIAYMLKNAANVDEALKLLEGIDMHSDIGSAHHYAMADPTGRSESVRAIFGADPVTGGKVKMNGKNVKISKPLDAMKHGIGYLPEDRKRDGIIADLSVRDNIILALQVIKGIGHPFSRAQAEAFADEYI